MSASQSSRPLGRSGIRKSGRLITPTNGGPEQRLGERESALRCRGERGLPQRAPGLSPSFSAIHLADSDINSLAIIIKRSYPTAPYLSDIRREPLVAATGPHVVKMRRSIRIANPLVPAAERSRGPAFAITEFATDSPLEGDGFELQVPRAMQARFNAKI